MAVGSIARRLGGLAVVAVVALLVTCPVAAGAALPERFFGVVPPGPSATGMAQMKANGVATARLPVDWGLIDPQQGQRDWSYYDAFVGELAAAGVEPQAVLFGVPGWISPHPATPPIRNAAHRQAWSRFVVEVATRYGRNGSFWQSRPELPYVPMVAWEIWNEPNLTGFWDGKPNPRAYVRLLQLTRAALLSADPAARLAVGGIFPPPRARYGVSMESFIQRLYRVRGARQAFDAIAIHPYASRPGGVLDVCRQLRRLITQNRDRGTEMWITELGWSTGGTGWRKSPFRATESAQARFLAKSFRALIKARRRLNLELLIWHTWQDTPEPRGPWTLNMGLLRRDGSPKPALHAFRRFAGRGG